jgi:hypothetical protein
MALEPIFKELVGSLHKLDDALRALQVTVEEGPSDDASALADGMENAVSDLMGSLHEARKAALAARQTVATPTPDLDRARKQLTVCHDWFDRVGQQFSDNLMACEKLNELERFGAERGGERLAWASSVKQGIEQCNRALNGASRALVVCWQEIVDHLITGFLAR